MKFELENRWRVVKLAQHRVGAGVLSIMLTGTLMLGATGCAQAQGATDATDVSSATAERAMSLSDSSADIADATASDQSSGIVVDAIDESLYDLEYTDRDSDPSYDEAKATVVELRGNTATASGDGVQVDGSTITITAEGVYVLAGTLDDGQVVVAAPEDAKVQLVLDGANITNADGAAIYVQQADKCFVTLAEGSDNSLADGGDYVLSDGEDEPDAVLFSTCDLTLQGTGSLKVTATYNDAVKTKDDLVVTGGTYQIEATGDGLVGKDSVKVADGTIEIKAGGDGVKSSKDDDESKGFVSIDGGALSIDAGDKGVKAATYLRVEDGTKIDVKSGDDAFHSDGVARIDGGTLSIEAGDDAVHAEYVLEVNGGDVDVSTCVEGYEAQEITINDGDTNIVSSDDGINAATAGKTAFAGTFGNSEKQDVPEGSQGVAPSGDKPNAQMLDGEADGASQGISESADSESLQQMGDHGRGKHRGQDGSMSGGSAGSWGGSSGSMGGMEGRGGMMDSDENCVLTINGGTITLKVEGDGLDSNGYLYLNGGEVYVSGPTNSGNGSIDYGVSATVNGGTLIAAGSSGMAEDFSSGSQAFALVQASGNAGDTVKVRDVDGKVLASFEAAAQFQCVVVTVPGMEDGQTYKLVVGSDEIEFTASTEGSAVDMGGRDMSGVALTDDAAPAGDASSASAQRPDAGQATQA